MSQTAVLSLGPAGLEEENDQSISNDLALPLIKKSLLCDKSSKPKTNTTKQTECIPYQKFVPLNMQNSLDDDTFSDVTFLVQDEEFYAIRALFAMQSPVFKSMLYGPMMESNPLNQVHLSDISVEAFKYLRSTFYNIFDKEAKHSILTASIVVDVLFAAEKYLIAPLITKCVAFIQNIRNVDDWFSVLDKLEKSRYKSQAKMYLNQLINEGEVPHVLQYKSLEFIQHEKWTQLQQDTVIILINSNNLASKEDDIWDALLKWTKSHTSDKCEKDKLLKFEAAVDDDRKNEEKQEPEVEELSKKAREKIHEFTKFIRFNQMEAAYFKQHIVDKKVLPADDIIKIMFARENGQMWKSSYNDSKRLQSKSMDSFLLKDVALSLAEIRALDVGDMIDFRDFYGLFCTATIISVNHEEHKIKIHYNSWGSTYDEWYVYMLLDNADNQNNGDAAAADDDDNVWRLNQEDRCQRIAKYGSITSRKIKRTAFREMTDSFYGIENESYMRKIEVKLSPWFWKKNESVISDIAFHCDEWISAKMISFKQNSKYSEHIKVGVYVNDDHYEWWVHPDNADEIRIVAPANNNYQ